MREVREGREEGRKSGQSWEGKEKLEGERLVGTVRKVRGDSTGGQRKQWGRYEKIEEDEREDRVRR